MSNPFQDNARIAAPRARRSQLECILWLRGMHEGGVGGGLTHGKLTGGGGGHFLEEYFNVALWVGRINTRKINRERRPSLFGRLS